MCVWLLLLVRHVLMKLLALVISRLVRLPMQKVQALVVRRTRLVNRFAVVKLVLELATANLVRTLLLATLGPYVARHPFGGIVSMRLWCRFGLTPLILLRTCSLLLVSRQNLAIRVLVPAMPNASALDGVRLEEIL